MPQSVSTIVGDYYRDHDRIDEAIYYYQKSIEENPNHVLSMLRLAEAFAIKGESAQVYSWYHKALAINPDIEASHILKYVFAFNANKNCEEAIKWAEIYKEKVLEDSITGGSIDTTLFILKGLSSINSDYSELGAVQFKDRLIYSSDKEGNSAKLFSATISSDLREANIQSLHEEINAIIADPQIAIAAHKGILFFGGKDPKDQSKNKIYYCDIPESPRDRIKIRSITFKDFDHSPIHPTVNSEGTVLYFCSEGKNGFDIFKSEKKGNDWSTPKLLGKNINTDGNEIHPFLHNDHTLFFASNGHDGLGGFDIFKVNLDSPDAPTVSLGTFINSPGDELSFSIDEKEKAGFLSSNRGGGEADIYQLNILRLPVEEELVKPDNLANLSIYSSGGDEVRMIGKKAENFRFSLTTAANYDLFINKYSYWENGLKDKVRPESMSLEVGTEYNFIIKKWGGSLVGPGGVDRGEVLRNLHANPGDLITFQFAPDGEPNPQQYESWKETKITFKYQEEKVSNKDTLALGYVVEEMPSSGTDEEDLPLASEETDEEGPSVAKEIEAKKIEMQEETLAANKKMNDGPEVDSSEIVETVASVGVIEDTGQEANLEPANQSPDSTALVAVVATKEIDSDMADATEQYETFGSEPTPALAMDNSLSTTAPEMNQATEEKSADEDDVGELQPAYEEKVTDDIAAQPQPEDVSFTTANIISHETREKAPDIDYREEDQSDVAAAPGIRMSDQEGASRENLPEIQADQDNERTIRYRVQIAASRVELSESKLNSIYHGDLEIRKVEEDDYFKYYIAEEPNYASARQIRNESGVENAFIIQKVYERMSEAPETDDIASIGNDEHPTKSEGSTDDNTDSNVRYLVQIAASRAKLGESKLNSIYPGNMEIRYFEEDNYFKYYIGEEPSISRAKQIRNESGVEGAFIIKKTYAGTRATYDKDHSISNEISVESPGSVVAGTDENADQGNIGGATGAPMVDKSEISPKNSDTQIAHDASAVENTSGEDEAGDIRYRVQIAASRKPLSKEALSMIYKGGLEISSFTEEKFYKYYVAEETNYFAAKKIMRESGVNQAFIAAYQGKEKLKLDEAIYAQYKKAMINSGLDVPGKIVDIIVVNFDFDEFVLLPEEASRLRENVIDRLLANESLYVIVNGHTDVQGSDSYNFGLSEERAMFVRKLVINDGIGSERVETHYFGESRQAKFCDEDEDCDESVHQANRRVEVILLER